jgi:uncharacterized protein YecE (DUF72 family)
MALQEESAVARNPNRRVWIGCSGYVYKHWKGGFYPQDLPTSKWLAYYARFFPTVELNNTHYMLPSEKTFEGWRDVILRFADEGRTVYIYFNNDPEGFAVRNALELTHFVNEVALVA